MPDRNAEKLRFGTIGETPFFQGDVIEPLKEDGTRGYRKWAVIDTQTEKSSHAIVSIRGVQVDWAGDLEGFGYTTKLDVLNAGTQVIILPSLNLKELAGVMSMLRHYKLTPKTQS